MACVTAHTRRRIAVGGQRRRLYTTRAPYWVKGLNFACRQMTHLAARSGMYFFLKNTTQVFFKNCMYILKKWYR